MLDFDPLDDADIGDSDIRDLNERVALLEASEDGDLRADLIGDLFRQYGLSAS